MVCDQGRESNITRCVTLVLIDGLFRTIDSSFSHEEQEQNTQVKDYPVHHTVSPSHMKSLFDDRYSDGRLAPVVLVWTQTWFNPNNEHYSFLSVVPFGTLYSHSPATYLTVLN